MATASENEYTLMSFAEFQEFIARIADVRFRNTELEHLSLGQKLLIVIDDILKRGDPDGSLGYQARNPLKPPSQRQERH